MKKKLFSLISLGIVIISLTGCYGVIPKLDMALKLGANEAWEFEMIFEIPQSIYSMSGSDFESQFADLEQEAATNGYNFEWEISPPDEDGNLLISTVLDGKGYEILNNEIFESNVVSLQEIDGKEVLSFNLSTYSSGIGDIFLLATESSFVLTGGKIQSTNGIQQNNNSVIWNNPGGVLSAEMEPPSNNTLAYILIIGGLILVGLSFYNLIIKKQSISKKVASTGSMSQQINDEENGAFGTNQETPNVRYCINCGTQLASGANFCIKCGSKQP